MRPIYRIKVIATFGEAPANDIIETIRSAACEVWPFDVFWHNRAESGRYYYYMNSQAYLPFDDSEQEFVQRLCQHIWHVVGDYVDITVWLTRFIPFPQPEIRFDRAKYNEFLNQQSASAVI